MVVNFFFDILKKLIKIQNSTLVAIYRFIYLFCNQKFYI